MDESYLHYEIPQLEIILSWDFYVRLDVVFCRTAPQAEKHDCFYRGGKNACFLFNRLYMAVYI